MLSVVEVSSLNSQILVDTFENCFLLKKDFSCSFSEFFVGKKRLWSAPEKTFSLLALLHIFLIFYC